jgi:hypothetical protein
VSSTGGAVYSPYREIICIPRFNSVGATHGAIGLLDAALNSYLSATANPTVIVI